MTNFPFHISHFTSHCFTAPDSDLNFILSTFVLFTMTTIGTYKIPCMVTAFTSRLPVNLSVTGSRYRTRICLLLRLFFSFISVHLQPVLQGVHCLCLDLSKPFETQIHASSFFGVFTILNAKWALGVDIKISSPHPSTRHGIFSARRHMDMFTLGNPAVIYQQASTALRDISLSLY